jgi:hypothetical protein
MTIRLDEFNMRANPSYDLVLLDRLTSTERTYLGDLENDLQVFGILRPSADGGLRLRSVCRETALLFLSLREPGLLPAFVKADVGDLWSNAVAQLVLDGVLEIEVDGQFVSGPESYRWVCDDAQAQAGKGRVGRLSIDALQYAQALNIADAARLSARLYFYNRLPASPSWHRRFPTSQAVLEYLTIDRGATRSALERSFSRMPPSERSGNGWIVWRSLAIDSPSHGPLYKVYLSPDPLVAAEALRATLEVLNDFPVVLLKVCKDVYSLLRPDKVVAYFKSRQEALIAAGALGDALTGLPAHGVPFTAAIDASGLVSWGVDPPRSEAVLGWQERESWRLWVTNRLAAALLSARSSRSNGVEPWRFAIERLRLAGVDPDSWTPTEMLWPDRL